MACIIVVFNERVGESRIDAFCHEIKTVFAARYREWGVECRGPLYTPREIPPSISVCVDDGHIDALEKAFGEFLSEDPRTSELVAGTRREGKKDQQEQVG